MYSKVPFGGKFFVGMERCVLVLRVSKNINFVERADENADFVPVLVKILWSKLAQMACAKSFQF